MTEELVRVHGVRKRYGGVQALDGVSLSLTAGAIHGWAGQNGAGKSTLGKIIAGCVLADDGVIEVDGREVRYASPREALALGIASVQQEISLVPQMTAPENVFLGAERQGLLGVNRAARTDGFAELAAQLGVDVPADVPVGRLSVAQQQQVEILRALARRARVIIFDEPTASLTADQAEVLHELMRSLRARGVAIVYVTHFLEHMLSVSDTISVLRDGGLVKDGPASAETVDTLIAAMLGVGFDSDFPTRPRSAVDAPEVLRVRDLSNAPGLRHLDLTVAAGEIVGLGGLVGSGRSEAARAIFGADRCGGTIRVDGDELRLRGPADAIRAGIALIPEDRKQQGLHLSLGLRENIALPHLRRLSTAGHVRRKDEREATDAALQTVGVAADRAEAPATTLSGGNQQRVLFAKWLLSPPRVLIADEPTRGVDVRAKQEIYQLLSDLALRGVAIVLISSDFEELLGLADRVVVLSRGVAVTELSGPTLNEHNLTAAAFGRVLNHAGDHR